MENRIGSNENMGRKEMVMVFDNTNNGESVVSLGNKFFFPIFIPFLLLLFLFTFELRVNLFPP